MSAWLWSADARAEARVQLRVEPAGERAERITLRTRELLQGLGVAVEVDAQGETALAQVAIDATDSTRVWIRIDSASGGHSAREVVLEDGLLDEAACEEVATVVSSSVEALLAGEPLPPAPPPAPLTAPTPAAPPTAPPAAATAPPAAAAAQTATAREPGTDANAATDTGPRGELQVRIGYEAALWGEGHVLHGPRLAASYGWPFDWGRLGVGVEGFVAVPGTVDSAGVDAELWASAVRLLAVADFPIGRGFAVEAAAGLAAQYTRLEVLSAPAAAEAREASTHWGWAMRLYGGARYRLGRRDRGGVALGLALELDPVQVQYGVQYADGFVVTHEPLPVRPSLVASGGMVF